MKALTTEPGNEFHRFKLAHLAGYVADVDAQILAVASSEAHVVALLELKRSTIPVEAWRPFAADRVSYRMLLELAHRAGLPLFVLYHVRGELELESSVAVFRLLATAPEFRYRRAVLTGAELVARWPELVA